MDVEHPQAQGEQPSLKTAQIPPEQSTDFQPIAFEGKAKEFFGIWISNLFLSIITLGIYSAWAKVRRIKYFYNNTKIDDFALNYHATGKQLLKGRLLVFAVFIVYSVVTGIFPISAPFFSIAFLFAAPWLINKSLRFSARMTSWRNVRLNWHGTYWRTFFFFVVGPILSVLSFTLLIPWFSRRYYQYYAEGHSFGVERFKAKTTNLEFFLGFLGALLIPFLIAFVFWLGMSVIFGNAQHPVQFMGQYVDAKVMFAPYAMMIFVYLSKVTFGAVCRNLLVRSMTLGEVASFQSQINTRRYLWITVSNLIAIVGSLGLLMPWAMVRRYAYLSEKTGVSMNDRAHEFIDEQADAMNSFGEEFADIDGLEVGI